MAVLGLATRVRGTSASLSWPGYIGVVTGVNRPGLSVNLLSVAARDASWRGMPEGLINRLLLEISLCALA
jgi:hypothetical protein